MDRIPGETRASRIRVTRRLVLAAAAILVVLAAVVVVAVGEDDDGTVTGPAGSTETTTTTRPSTTATDGTTTSTTGTTSPTGSSPGTTDSTGSGGPPGSRPSVRSIDFANETYVRPCPSLADMDVTLADGSGFMETVPNQNSYNVELHQVTYGDADGDGDEDAMVVLFCHHQRAEAAAVWAGMFGVSTSGGPLAIGDPLRVENVAGRPPIPAMGTVTVRVYPQPQSRGEPVDRTWQFADGAFQPTS